MNEQHIQRSIDTARVYWEDIQNKPNEYPVEYHTHPEYAKRYHKHSVEDISDLDNIAKADHLHDDRYYTKEEVDGRIDSIDVTFEADWSDILNKPTLFPPTNHIHDEFYTKDEIKSILKHYAPLEHTHTIDDIEGLENLPDNDDSNENESGNGNTNSEPYSKFFILPNYWDETPEGLFSCVIQHNLNTKNVDTIARYENGAYALVDIECNDYDELTITAIDEEALVLFVRKITTL